MKRVLFRTPAGVWLSWYYHRFRLTMPSGFSHKSPRQKCGKPRHPVVRNSIVAHVESERLKYLHCIILQNSTETKHDLIPTIQLSPACAIIVSNMYSKKM